MGTDNPRDFALLYAIVTRRTRTDNYKKNNFIRTPSRPEPFGEGDVGGLWLRFLRPLERFGKTDTPSECNREIFPAAGPPQQQTHLRGAQIRDGGGSQQGSPVTLLRTRAHKRTQTHTALGLFPAFARPYLGASLAQEHGFDVGHRETLDVRIVYRKQDIAHLDLAASSRCAAFH